MPALPTVGGDNGTWGQKLNDFLSVELDPTTGALKTAGQGGSAEIRANKGQANGYAPLDGSGKVPSVNLPASGSGLPSGGNAGDIIVNTAPGTGAWTAVDTTVLLDDLSDVSAASPANGDMLYYNGTVWAKVAGTKAAGKVAKIQNDGSVAWDTDASGGGGGGGPVLPYRTGFWYYALSHVTLSTTTIGPVINRLYAVPFVVQETKAFDRIACEVTGTGGAGCIGRMGIYADNGDGYPGALLVNAGSADLNTSGIRELTINQSLSPGVVWLAFVEQVTDAVQVRGWSPVSANGSAPPIGRTDGSVTGIYQLSYCAAGSSGVLPDPFPSSIGPSTDAPVLTLRAA
jgi:hypothetical protein